MKIALFGYGKMGKVIEACAEKNGHEITARINGASPKESFNYSSTDVIIEFSRPESAVENIRFAIEQRIPIVVGTTGWYDQLEELTNYCSEKNGALLHATNFSIGVNVFFALNRYLAKIMNGLPQYTADILEIHHTEKLDAPSGTGITLAEELIQESQQFTSWQNKKPGDIKESTVLPLASERTEGVPGTHTVNYQSTIDSISMTHTAHNREGFAMGSILAADWLKDKKGVYNIQDILNF